MAPTPALQAPRGRDPRGVRLTSARVLFSAAQAASGGGTWEALGHVFGRLSYCAPGPLPPLEFQALAGALGSVFAGSIRMRAALLYLNYDLLLTVMLQQICYLSAS